MLLAGLHRDGKSIPRRWERAGRKGSETTGWIEGAIEVDSSASVRVGFLDDEEPTAPVGGDARCLVGEHHEEALATGVGKEGVFDAVDLESKRASNLMRLDEFRHESHVDGGAFRGGFEDRVDPSIRIEGMSLDAGKHPERLRISITDSQGRSLLAMNVGDVKAADPEYAEDAVAVISQDDRLVRSERHVVQTTEVVLARCEGDLAVVSKNEPPGGFRPGVGEHDSISVRSPGGSQSRFAGFQPDQTDQAEPAFGLSQFGISIANPFSVFFVERGHGGRGRCSGVRFGRSAGNAGEEKDEDEQVTRSHCGMLVDQPAKGNRCPGRCGSEAAG